MKGFAAMPLLLHEFTKKDVVYHWTPECHDAFLQLKHLLTTAPITSFPDFNLPFQLLAQVQGGLEHIICCASQTLTQMEKNYLETKLEYLAIVWATGKLYLYLMSNKFDFYAGHYALHWLKSMRTGSALLHCWSVALEEFDFTVHHRPGRAQTIIDVLSRLLVEQVQLAEEAALIIKPLSDEAFARQAAW